jgi:hypothetical protein
MDAVETEHKTRLFWTCYIFECQTGSRLGTPLGIDEDDIEADMPSATLPENMRDKFVSSAHLIANIGLARITGRLLKDIYGASARSHPGNFVNNVRNILNELRKWDAGLSPALRLSQNGTHRPVASLQLYFNQCIILTTRPVLLHVLKSKRPFGSEAEANSTPPITDAARMLADACVSAARTSNGILSQLFIERSLATYGFFDAHHMFSSTLILIISAIVSPNSSDSDAVQTAFHLLKAMRDSGNLAAHQYYARLASIHWHISRLRARATANNESFNHAAEDSLDSLTSSVPSGTEAPTLSTNDFEDQDWSVFFMSSNNLDSYDWTGLGGISANDPLDNPLLQTFLDNDGVQFDDGLGIGMNDTDFVF